MAWDVHFADELAAECVNDTSNGGLLALADEVEVEHALHGTGLQAAVRTLLAKACGHAAGSGVLTRQSIVSWDGRGCARAAGSSHGWEPQNDGCCRWQTGPRWRCLPG